MTNMVKYDDLCWWCGNLANSAEHVYKKTDLEREFGKRKKFTNNQPVKFKDEISPLISIETSKSKNVKFPKSLCETCNNITSQPHDYSYDKFVSYYKNNEHEIYNRQIIDFEVIYGSNWKNEYLNLLRYFAKNFCCRIHSQNLEIFEDIIAFLNGNSSLKTLDIRIYIRDDIYKYLELADTGFLHRGKLHFINSKKTNEIEAIETTTSYRSLTIGFYYSKNKKPPFWKFNPNPKLYLPIWFEDMGYK